MTNLIIGAEDGLLVQQSGRMCNRHGLVAGATGTGKTVTLQTLAEGFSRMGTPVFAVDVKGDLPETVLGQLGLKLQHALRAFTPKDQKNIRAVAESFVPNPRSNTADTVTTLAIGEALVSVMGEDGRPQPVKKTLIAPPEGRIGPLVEKERVAVIQRSPIRGRYDDAVDRQSAYEMLQQRAEAAKMSESRHLREVEREKMKRQEARKKTVGGRQRQSVGEAMIKSAARSIGSSIGRQIIRGVLGSLFGKR